MSRPASTFARFVGLAALGYGGVMSVGALVDAFGGSAYDPFWFVYLVLWIGMTGIAGALAFLLSIDGPPRWRTRTRRALGWLGMLICALLPAGFLYIIGPLVLLGGLTLLLSPELPDRRRGRHLATSG
ncbi:MAG: hypothetical protein ACRDZM_00795 [Acidimicrobiia bacterium]